jgi:hypothetical protein
MNLFKDDVMRRSMAWIGFLGVRRNERSLVRLALAGLSLLVLGLAACQGGLPGAGSSFAGTYVNHAAGEFSVADDTLVVEQVRGELYRIVRHLAYVKLDEQGKVAKPVRSLECWKAVLDKETGLLTELKKGRVLTGNGDTLLLENSAYRRVK